MPALLPLLITAPASCSADSAAGRRAGDVEMGWWCMLSGKHSVFLFAALTVKKLVILLLLKHHLYQVRG